MGTRTNFYKNPSFTYKKDFNLNSVLRNLRAYNAATGNALSSKEPVAGGNEIERPKRLREKRPPPDPNIDNNEKDGPISHRDYIEKRRKEVNSSHVYEELTADVLGNSHPCTNLVEYDRVLLGSVFPSWLRSDEGSLSLASSKRAENER